MKRSFVLVLLSVLALPLCGAPKLSKEAVDIPVGGGTTFWMYYPEVKVNGDQQRPSGVEIKDRVAVLSYRHGAKVELTAASTTSSFTSSCRRA